MASARIFRSEKYRKMQANEAMWGAGLIRLFCKRVVLIL